MNEKTLNGFDLDSGVASVLPSFFAGIWMTNTRRAKKGVEPEAANLHLKLQTDSDLCCALS